MSSPDILRKLEMESVQVEKSETSPRPSSVVDPSDFLFTRFQGFERRFADVGDPEVLEQKRIAKETVQSIAKYKLDDETLHTLIQRVYDIAPYECRQINVPDPSKMQKSIDEAEERLALFMKTLPFDEKEQHELYLDVKYLIDIRFFIIFRYQQAVVDTAALMTFSGENKKK